MLFIRALREMINIVNTFERISLIDLRTAGLTTGQFDVIATLGNQEPMTCKELADKTLMLKGNLSVVLNGLLKKNYITRSKNPADGRSSIIGLTKLGDQVFQEVFYAHLAFLQPLYAKLDDTKLEGLRVELKEIRLRLEQHLRELSA